MRLLKTALNRPITTFMIFFACILIGSVCLLMLPLDLMPKIEAPIVSIITTWPGASAEDVEMNVTKHIENELGIVNNLDEIRSISKEGVSIVNCIFTLNSDLHVASNDVKEKLELIKYKFASDVSQPMIFKFDTTMLPIVMYGITAKEHWENLHEITDTKIASFIKRLEGVGSVQLFGGLEKQINIQLDQKKLTRYSMTPKEIEFSLKAHNFDLPAGNIVIGNTDYMIRIPGKYQKVSEIENTLLKPSVYLRDVASIENGFKEKKANVEINKKPALLLFVQKKSGANTLKVATEVKRKVKSLQKNLPKDLEIITIMDSSEFINRAMHNLLKTILLAVLFVSIITLFFLRNLRASFIIICTIPFSIMVAFSFIHFMGWSLNTISFAALAIAIGMVVDNAVVVVDNIIKKLDKGKDPKQAAFLGTQEVSSAIFASTMTTIVIFLPLVFISGIVGVMFQQMGGVVTITLLSSLLCALMFTPMLATKILKKPPKIDFLDAVFEKIEKKYLYLLKFVMTKKKKTFFVIGGVIVFVFLLLPFIGSEFMPEEDSGDLQITFDLPVGTPLEKTADICKKIEELALKLIDPKIIERSYWRSGTMNNSMGSAMGGKEGAHIGVYGMKLVKKDLRNLSTKEAARKIADQIKKWPEILSLTVNAGNPMSQIVLRGAKPVSIEILGHDLEQTEKLAKEIQKIAQDTPGTKDITISRNTGRPELVIKPNREKASSLGIDMALLANTLRAFFHGKEASTFKQGENSYSIFLQAKEKKSLEDIQNTEITTRNNTKIRLDSIASIKEKKGPVEIERKNQERVVRVDIDTYKRSQGEISSDIQARIKKELTIPEEITITFGGMVKEQTKSFRYIFYLLILSIFLVYMVMASQFESLKDPLIIMFSVPFAFVGVIISLALTNTHLSIMSLIGVLMLIGIVVNNAIVIIDYINYLRKEKMEKLEAIYLAGKRRLRPVLITTLTTIFGMIPLILNKKEGAEIWKPFAITVIGGLSVSTLITLIVIPLLYHLFHKEKTH